MTRSFGAADGTGESVRNEMKQKLKTGTFRSVVRAVLHYIANYQDWILQEKETGCQERPRLVIPVWSHIRSICCPFDIDKN